jgi:hypothetical protein
VAAGRARGIRPRRVSLPGVHELLRPPGPGPASDSGRQASGREAHSQKITVYLSVDELIDLERARLTLRSRGISVDRGRLVREAIAVLLADLESGVEASVIARRLRGVASSADGGFPVTGASVPNGAMPVTGVTVPGAVPVAGAPVPNGAMPVTGATVPNGAMPVTGATVPNGAMPVTGAGLVGGPGPLTGAGPVAGLPAEAQ